VLWLRRAAIVLLAVLAHAYHRSTGSPASLASIGLLAFAAVAQFAPAILAGLYWRGATREGVFWGLAGGFVVWIYTLLLPTLGTGPFVGTSLLAGAALAVGVNVLLLVSVSRLRGVSLRERMTAAGFDIRPGQHPIVPVMLYEEALAHDMAEALLDEGIYVVGFSYPVVPKGAARIRVQISAAHTDEQIDRAVEAFTRVGKRLGVVAL